MSNNPSTPEQYLNYQPSQPPMLSKTQVLGLDYNIAGLLCYVPFGFIPAAIFLVTEPKQSRFVRFHAAQSLLLGAAFVGLGIVLGIINSIMMHVPVIGLAFALLMIPVSLLIFLGGLILMVVLIMKAYQNQMWQLPVIGRYAQDISSSTI